MLVVGPRDSGKTSLLKYSNCLIQDLVLCLQWIPKYNG